LVSGNPFERLDFRSVRDSKRRREQLLAIPQRHIDHRLLDAAQVDPRAVARDLSIERRLAIGERNDKAEFSREEIARRLDIGDKQLGFRTGDDGFAGGRVSMIRHGVKSFPERLKMKARVYASITFPAWAVRYHSDH
jgi:hypothetical protein